MQFDFQNSPFGNEIKIPDEAKIVFVSDMFVEDYVGGAELTSQALIDESPFQVFKLHSKDVSMELLSSGVDRFWVFGNFCELNPQLLPSIIGNLRYTVLEYDYKFCQARSPEKHQHMTGAPCDCSNQMNGKMISAFFFGSMGLWWMSEKQKDVYLKTFPFLAEKDNIVLSSVFSKQTLGFLKHLRESAHERSGWIVLGSQSWIKGADDAERWCKDNKKEYKTLWNLPYDQLLAQLAVSEGFVYLPKGGDTCPRMVIEAKLLGCKTHLNENVQHSEEEWFNTDDLDSISDYLFTAPGIFWSAVKKMIDYKPTISGYATTYNCVKQKYPFRQCIKSMLSFCDEVCVVDGGSDDETLFYLAQLAYPDAEFKQHVDFEVLSTTWASGEAGHYDFPDEYQGVKKDPRVKVRVIPRDWTSKRHPVFDGLQKAAARELCTKEFCWQMDSDEVVHEEDAPKIADMCRSLPKGIDILALPVIEYWGGPEKVRMDIQPWKWRLSRNAPHITHGIPSELRKLDANGDVYALEGTDGCDMINKVTGERVQHLGFYTPDVDNVRRVAMIGNEQARAQYEQWFNAVVAQLPGVFHYSWFDLPRKIRLYRDYWQNHWNALWDKDASDTATNNMMFGVPWAEVTDEMIDTKAAAMKEKLGGWIWHRQWDGKTTTPHIKCTRTQPKIMIKP
jgi:glycosyltransferase involved in cell wall biosynthesis